MKPFNTKLILSALGIVALLTSPAFARTSDRQQQWQQTRSQAVEQYPELGCRDVPYRKRVEPI